MLITNNHDSFHLWWHENFVKHQNVSRYYGQDYSFCDYSDAYIIFKGNISVNNNAGAGAAANNTGKKVIFKNCAPFTNCISKINYTQIDNEEDIDIIMPM